MKKLMYLCLMVAVMPLTSCSSDDDDGGVDNFVKIGDEKHSLSYGLAIDYGEYNTGSYNIDLTLMSSKVDFDTPSFSGKVRGVYFEIFSSTPNKLEPGTYQFNESKETFTFDDASYFYYNDNNEYETFIKSGSITIHKSGKDYYELSFEFIDVSDQTISGKYYGKVDYLEDEEF